MQYTNFGLGNVSISADGVDWIPLKGNITAIESDYAALEYDWQVLCRDFPPITFECTMPSVVPWLRVFSNKPTMARRKIWRYMERCGL
jgi:hypothetical protein